MKAKKRKKESWNDLLLPIVCVLCVMPFLVHLAEYDYGYSGYLWHSDDSIAQDLYAYYRSYFFELVAIISLCVLAFRMILYREKNKPSGIFLPMVIYAIFAVLSTFFSVNIRASLTGNFYQFMNIFVLLGCCLMSFYAYQIMEKEEDYRSIVRAVIVMFLFISITGWFQVFKHDLLNFEWIQRLVMSKEQFAEYGGEIADVFSGNNVFLTLYNPNYAAVFLVMFTAMFAVLSYGEQEKKKKVFYLVLLISSLILLWFTYTRAALVALVIGTLVFILCRGKELKKSLKYILPGIAALVIVCIAADGINDFRYLSRMIEDPKEYKLENIRTGKNGITITYDGITLVLTMKNGSLTVTDSDGKGTTLKKDKSGEVRLPFPEEFPAMVTKSGEETICILQIEEQTLEFVRTKDGYFYRNGDGKLDQMADIPKVDMHGREYLASGRLYIWSRVLPMLKDYLLVGSGPDTFAEVYPQNDYVGKMLYAENPRRVMESAHNDYLTRWVQTGMVSLVALLVFYVLFLKECFSYYRNCSLDTRRHQLGFGCFLACIGYLVCCFFSDSSLYATPVFFVLAGISLAATVDEKKKKAD